MVRPSLSPQFEGGMPPFELPPAGEALWLYGHRDKADAFSKCPKDALPCGDECIRACESTYRNTRVYLGALPTRFEACTPDGEASRISNIHWTSWFVWSIVRAKLTARSFGQSFPQIDHKPPARALREIHVARTTCFQYPSVTTTVTTTLADGEPHGVLS